MTIHLKSKSICCKECDAEFIPLKKEFKCPKCDRLIPLPLDLDVSFINRLAGSMELHKRRYGSYTPGAWYNGCFADMIQFNIYCIFDNLENDNPENPKDYINTFINNSKFEKDQEYLKKYLTDTALMVHDIYEKEDFVSIKEDVLPLGDRVRRWFRGFLP